jgi:PIN domain nuclease of toxin-antitoxin system
LRAFEAFPLLHRDPFDRPLIAQSVTEQIPVITNDRALSAYGTAVIW